MKGTSHPAIFAALLALALAIARDAQAAEATPDTTLPYTLEDYLNRLHTHNADLRVAAADSGAAHARIGVARGYPDPVVLYGYYFDADESGHVPSMKGRSELTFMQEIPFFGKRGMRGDVAKSESMTASQMVRTTQLDLEYELKARFFELARAHEVERMLQQERALVEQMRDVSFARYSSGMAEQFEVLKLEMAIAEIDDQLTMNDHDRAMAGARLNELIGRDPTGELPPPRWVISEGAGSDSSMASDTAMSSRPEVAAAHAEIEGAESFRRLASREYLPDFMIGLQWEFGGEPDALGNRMGDSWEVMAGISLPLWFGKRRAASREADARAQGAQHRLDAVQRRVAREVEVSMHGVLSSRERLRRFEREILPRAEQAFRSTEASYRSGRADLLDYLDGERTWLTARREYYDVAAQLGTEIAGLERALGRSEVKANETAR